MMIPILRLADNLDSSGEQRISAVECRVREGGGVVLQVRASGDIDLDQWAAERAGEVFQHIYHRPIQVVKARE